MSGERPARPPEAQELGLTDLVWNMTCKCWRQDPARRPTVMEVVGLLREWSVFSLPVEPISRHTSCSYRLRNLSLPLSSLAPSQPVEDVDPAKHRAPISQIPTNQEPTPTQSSGTLQHSGQMHLQTHETLVDPEKSIFTVSERSIDEMAEVTQPVLSPSDSDHTPTLGACGYGRNFRGENLDRSFKVV